MLERIGKYEIRLQLGRGGMGVVYEGFDPLIGRRVAIKTLRTDVIEPDELPEFLARFRREAQSAGRLSHPHIVTIYEYGEQDGMPYIVMEYISGRDLSAELKHGVRFELDGVVRLMTQLLGALAHAHEHGVVHRDIKPQNILLLEDGSLKVVDFGIARLEEGESFTRTGLSLGTPAYMAPEQVLGLRVTAKTDIFSCGTLLYQLLTGDRPFTGDEYSVKQKVLKLEPVRPSELNPLILGPWDAVVARAMAKISEARYESARHFLEAVRAAHEAQKQAAEEMRRKAKEAEEHALREAQARSCGAALKREEEARQTAAAEAREQAEAAGREALRREAERAARFEAEARAARESAARAKQEAAAAKAPAGARRRAWRIAGAAALVIAAAGIVLYMRREAEIEASKAEAVLVVAEQRAREEAEKRARAESVAREEVEKRSRLEAEAKAQAEAEGKAKARAEEKAKTLALKREDEEKRRAELAATKGTEAKARAEATTKGEGERQAARSPGLVFQDCPECPRMVAVPAGDFSMGSSATEAGRDDNEGPRRTVVIHRPFAVSVYEVTFHEWDACVHEGGCSHNPGDAGWGRGRKPVIYVSWSDAKQYAAWLSRKTAKRYRLLTEAEWEYVARAGTTIAFSVGNTISRSQARFGVSEGTAAVGSYGPNAFGLYDVHGNVWEWTEDCWNASYDGAPSDGSAWLSGDCSRRVFRGGSWNNGLRFVRSAYRSGVDMALRTYFVGFRLARTLE